jgi:Tc5 transposase DNA-binding domain
MDSLKTTQIERAIAHLNAQERPNYAAAVKLFEIDRTTLWRRYKSLTVSRAEANSTYRQRLNNTQEDELLRYINNLTDRHIPLTTQIIKNLAEEMLKGPVRKNWIAEFIKRHSKRIYSFYLQSLNHARASAESITVFQHFYALVYTYFSFYRNLLISFF